MEKLPTYDTKEPLITYNKLVRDRIPEIIEAEGKRANIRTMDENEYRTALMAKLGEEVGEYEGEPSLEELADILEVVLALAAVHGCTPEDLERARSEKARERGGFSRRVFLETVHS